MTPENQLFFHLNNSTPRDDEAIRLFYAMEQANFDRQGRELVAMLAVAAIATFAAIAFAVLRCAS